MSSEQRRHQRHPVELRVKMRLPGGDVEAFSSLVSREGMSVRLPEPVDEGTRVSFIIHLPDGNVLIGQATCRNQLVDGLCGFAIEFDAKASAIWEAFIAQEEATGSLWRMISRYNEGRHEAGGSVRDVVLEREVDVADDLGLGGDPDARRALRFHTVGENGEAYRVLFERCPSVDSFDSDLMAKIPGFPQLAEKAVARVLEQDIIIRLGEHAPLQRVRVAELRRGGHAYVLGGGGMPVGLVSLAVGELLLIEVDGETVFPHFTPDELERIACDTFRSDQVAPMFSPPFSPPPFTPPPLTPLPVDLGDLPTEGIRAVKAHQDLALHVQRRTYGDRSFSLYPELWGRSRRADGFDVMGPTMRDGDRVLLLVLVGRGAPRILRLDDDDDIKLMEP